MEGYEWMALTQDLPLARTGWRGVWDALEAAVTGRPRIATVTPYRFEVRVKASPDAVVRLACVSASVPTPIR